MIIDFNHPDFNKYWSILVNRFPNSPPHFQESIMRFIAQRVIDNGLKIENKSFVILENEDVKAGLYLPSVNNKNVKDALAYEIPGLVLEDNLTTKTKNLFINEFKNRYNDINGNLQFTDILHEGFVSSLGFKQISLGAKIVPEIVGMIDLKQSELELLSGLRRQFRSIVNTSSDSMDIIIYDKTNINNEILEDFRILHIEAAEKEMRTKSAWYMLKDIVLEDNGFIICGYKDSKMVSAGCFIYNTNSSYYLMSASKRSMFDKPLFHIIMWNAIIKSKALGCKQIQVGKKYYSNFPNENYPFSKEISISKFKNGFGGTNKIYFNIDFKK